MVSTANADGEDVPNLEINNASITSDAVIYYNTTNVRIKFSKKEDGSDLTSAVLTFNGDPVPGFDIISGVGYSVTNGEGVYCVTITNAAGNSAVANFVIDTTAPVYAGVENNKYYNVGEIDVTYSDALSGMERVTVNGVEQAVGTEYHVTDLTEGKYTLVFTDRAGNVSSAIVHIDLTPPTVNGVEENGIYSHVDIEIVDVLSGLKTLRLNGEVKTGNRLTVDAEDGHPVEMTLEATDNAGNVKTVHFVVDKEAPTATVSNDQSTEVKADVPYKGEIWVTWDTESAPGKYNNTDVSAVYSVNDGPYIEYANGTHFTDGGHYTVVLTNAAGITSTFSFIIDDYVDINVLEDNGNVLMNGGITFNSAVIQVNEELALFVLTRTAFDDNHEVIPVEYTYGSLITEPGYYEFNARDTLGNEMHYTFYVIDSLMNHYFIYKRPIGYVFYSVKRNGYDTYVNDKMEEIPLDAEGYFEVTIKNIHDGRTVEYYIRIDTKPPEISTTGLVSGSNITNNNVIITAVSDDCVKLTVTRDGFELDYTLGEVLNVNGQYVLLATDKAGNQTKIEFTLKKTINVIYLVFGAILGAALNIVVGYYADKRRLIKENGGIGFVDNAPVQKNASNKNSLDYHILDEDKEELLDDAETVALDPMVEKPDIEIMDLPDMEDDYMTQVTIDDEHNAAKKQAKKTKSVADKREKKETSSYKGKLVRAHKTKKPKKSDYDYLSSNTLDDPMFSGVAGEELPEEVDAREDESDK